MFVHLVNGLVSDFQLKLCVNFKFQTLMLIRTKTKLNIQHVISSTTLLLYLLLT
jgi:hypothetical protein